MDVLRVYVVFNPDHQVATQWYERLLDSFDCIGMQREGLRFGVPVHRRCQPWGEARPGLAPANPRRIDFSHAEWNVVVVLQDVGLADQQELWEPYLADVMRQHQNNEATSWVIPVELGQVNAASLRYLQGIPKRLLTGAPDERSGRQFFIALLNAVLVKMNPPASRHAAGSRYTVFVSHAKRDGSEAAQRVAERLSQVMQRLGPECFFDVDSLIPGDDYPQRFEAAIREASLLALITDTYHARPWCRWEMLCAKKHGRPVVVAELGRGRIERSFPYVGNVPTLRLDDSLDELSNDSIEILIQALLSESLRVELWRRLAGGSAGDKAVLLIRPPELSDIALVAAEHPGALRRVLYPDPPLSTEEIDLLQAAFPHIEILTLSQAIQ